MMKVGFLINDLSSGGAEQATCGLCGYLANNGIDATIVTVNDCVPFYDVNDKVKLVSLSCDDIEKNAGFKRLWLSVKKSFYIRKKIRSFGFDIIVGMSNIMSYYLVFSTLFTKTKCIGTERTDPFHAKNGIIHRCLKKISGKLSDGYIFQTTRQQQYYPHPRCKKSAVIPNAVFNKYAYMASVPSEREKTLTALARLSREKRYEDLINAFSIFNERISGYTLQIYGEGPEKEKLQSLVESLNLQNSVIFNGTKKDAIMSVANSSVYVLCSEYEGFPNSLLEALYCGVPSVSTDSSPAVKEMIDNNSNGIIVKTGDVNQIATAIERIVTNEELSNQLSNNAVSSAQKYHIDNIGKKWIEYFDFVLNKKQA